MLPMLPPSALTPDIAALRTTLSAGAIAHSDPVAAKGAEFAALLGASLAPYAAAQGGPAPLIAVITPPLVPAQSGPDDGRMAVPSPHWPAGELPDSGMVLPLALPPAAAVGGKLPLGAEPADPAPALPARFAAPPPPSAMRPAAFDQTTARQSPDSPHAIMQPPAPGDAAVMPAPALPEMPRDAAIPVAAAGIVSHPARAKAMVLPGGTAGGPAAPLAGPDATIAAVGAIMPVTPADAPALLPAHPPTDLAASPEASLLSLPLTAVPALTAPAPAVMASAAKAPGALAGAAGVPPINLAAAVPAALPAASNRIATPGGKSPASGDPLIDLAAPASPSSTPSPALASPTSAAAPVPVFASSPAMVSEAGAAQGAGSQPGSGAPDFDSAAEQLASYRDAARSARPELTLRHGEFGAVHIRLEASASAGDWRAILSSRDPGFVPAVQTALAASSSGDSTGQQGSHFGSRSGDPGAGGPGSQGSGQSLYGSSPGSGQGSSQPYSGQGSGQPRKAAASADEAASEGITGTGTAPGGVFA